MKKIIDTKGFTLIEVSLVLAIGGLIFLAVFVAFPALQRNTRDTERREDMIYLAEAIKKYQQNNRGSLPNGTGSVTYDSSTTESSKWVGFYKDYLGGDFKDPTSGSNYMLVVASCGVSSGSCKNTYQYKTQTFPNDYKIAILTGATCDGETAIYSSNPRKVAIVYKLELGAYCGST